MTIYTLYFLIYYLSLQMKFIQENLVHFYLIMKKKEKNTKQKQKLLVYPIYEPNNNKAMSINYKKIKLWTDYFYRFEKGENTKHYLKQLNIKVNSFENELKKKQEIIEEITKFLINQNIDLNSLSQNCKEEIEKFIVQSDIKLSFEILDPSKSILNMKNNNK